MLIVDEDFEEFSNHCTEREFYQNSDRKIVRLCRKKLPTGLKCDTCYEEDCPRLSGL